MKNIDISCGFLAPSGEFFPCKSYEHLYKAKELCDKLGLNISQLEAEDYLLNNGYLVIRSRDVWGNIGFPKMINGERTGSIIHLGKEQRQWLTDHYESFNDDKRRDVDKIMDQYDAW